MLPPHNKIGIELTPTTVLVGVTIKIVIDAHSCWVISGSNNGLLPVRHEVINSELLSNELGNNNDDNGIRMYSIPENAFEIFYLKNIDDFAQASMRWADVFWRDSMMIQ